MGLSLEPVGPSDFRAGGAVCQRTDVRPNTQAAENFFAMCCAQRAVTAVTESVWSIGDTAVVNKVRGAGKKAPLEPGDTRQPWKGEAAASLVMCRDHQ
jgi:hypothetical protein